jgi:hypothetical protein
MPKWSQPVIEITSSDIWVRNGPRAGDAASKEQALSVRARQRIKIFKKIDKNKSKRGRETERKRERGRERDRDRGG